MSRDQSTEQNILGAAEKIFLRSGIDGARMQAIADEAKINKAMLHYYFKSKDALFEKVFEEKAKLFFPEIEDILKEDISFLSKVEHFIDTYSKTMVNAPYIPLFVISTINKPGKEDFIQKLPIQFQQHLMRSYFQDLEKGVVRKLNPLQFFLSLMGMCIFPFLGKPFLTNVFGLASDEFVQFIEQRKTELKSYVRLILEP